MSDFAYKIASFEVDTYPNATESDIHGTEITVVAFGDETTVPPGKCIPDKSITSTSA